MEHARETPESCFNRGAALAGQGQWAAAADAYRRALELRPDFPEAHVNLGNVLRRQGQLPAAVDAYRRAIALRPQFPEAFYNLGVALRGQARVDDAISAYQQALALRPDYAAANYNLGNVLQERGRLAEAAEAFRRAVALQLGHSKAGFNLGATLEALGRPEEAVAAFRQALAAQPNFPQAHLRLGMVLHALGRLEEAIGAYHQAIASAPDMAEAYNNLGVALRMQGNLNAAVEAHRKAVALAPRFAEALSNLGVALAEQGHVQEAIAAHRQAVALEPGLAKAVCNLGAALAEAGALDEAEAAYRRALSLQPEFPEAWNNLGIVLKDSGQADGAIEAFRAALRLRTDYADAHSSLIVHMHYHPEYDGRAIAEELRHWNALHAATLKRFNAPHANAPDPERRLRIGYVSPDFTDHPVGRFMVPLLTQHDRKVVEVFAYAQVGAPDGFTEKLRGLADGWHSVAGISDGDVAAMIRDDRIDILVDLALHTAHHRLLVFARKPAPVQVTFAGYPGSTGLETIDYRLSDPYLDPPDRNLAINSEETVRLPESFWCYEPFEGRAIPVAPLPALQTGHVTFGCLNNFCKVNARQLALWGRVMREVAGSRLVLLAPVGSARERTLAVLGREGIDAARVEFVARMTRQAYLETFQRIDVGLDTYPYNGHTTSLDSFWMGVPMVTLVGDSAVARAGLCQLSNLGLAELAANSTDDFVRIAKSLAGNLPRLAELRSTLRHRMEQSPLMDQPRLARHLEAAYRHMWRRWCAGTVR